MNLWCENRYKESLEDTGLFIDKEIERGNLGAIEYDMTLESLRVLVNATDL
jgi:hypothetical protein